MFKRILLMGFIFTTLSSQAFATLFPSMPTRGTDFTSVSPYIGINAGYNDGFWKATNNGNTVKFQTYGGKGGLFAGIGGTLCPGLYLAGEIFGNRGATSSTFHTFGPAPTGKIRNTYDFGVSLIPGYIFYPGVILFARFGFIAANINWTQTPGPSGVGGSVSNIDKTLGAQFGFGLQTCITSHISIRAEYDYASYEPRTFFGATTINPQNNQLNLGLLYKFL